MQVATGDYVFAQENYEPLFLEDMKKLWQLRGDPGVLMARAKTRTRRIDQALINKLTNWGKQVEEAWMGKPNEVTELQMFCRDAIHKLGNKIHEGGEVEVTHLSHRRVAKPNLPSLTGEKQAVNPRAPRWAE